MKFKDATKLGKNIAQKMKEHKNDKPLNSGVIGEQLVIASYDLMDIQQLEGMRIIINHLIKKKKHFKKMQNKEKLIEDNKEELKQDNICST